MKKLSTLTFLLLVLAQVSFSQSEFKKAWQTKVSVTPKWNAYNNDLSMVLIGDLKEIEMLDGTSGKSLWKLEAKKFGIKALEDWFFLVDKQGEPVKVIYKKPKDSQKTELYLNPKTGETLASFSLKDKDKEQIQPRKKSKTIFASSAFDEASNTYLKISYNDRLVKSAMKGTELDLNIEAAGGNNWSTSVRGRAVRHLCDNLLSWDEPEMMMNIFAANEKVFVVYEGISVLDLKTGKLLWNTSFDNVQTSVGLKASQEIGRSALPVADKNAVYVCDFSKGEKSIKRLDINTGQVVWEGQKLSKDDVVSQLMVVDNLLIAKFGGIIRKEKFIPSSSGGVGAGVYKVNFDYEGTTAIKAYDIKTGKEVWSSEQLKGDSFSKSESSVMLDGNNLIACSNSSFYILNAQNGNVIHKSALGSKEIGKAQAIFAYDGNYIVKGDEGIASFSKTANRNFATSTGKCLLDEFRGDAYIVWTGKDIDDMNEFVRLDLSNGKILGKLKGCYKPRFNTTGDHFLRFNDEVITLYKTN